MRGLSRRLSPIWQVLRRRRPVAAARVEEAALVVRTRGDLVHEVRALRTRLAELERDHLLLAAHVSVLTERAAQVAPPPSDPDDEAARQRARLAAVAFYEERMGRLEGAVARLGRARAGRGRTSSARTPGERQDRVA